MKLVALVGLLVLVVSGCVRQVVTAPLLRCLSLVGLLVLVVPGFGSQVNPLLRCLISYTNEETDKLTTPEALHPAPC